MTPLSEDSSSRFLSHTNLGKAWSVKRDVHVQSHVIRQLITLPAYIWASWVVCLVALHCIVLWQCLPSLGNWKDEVKLNVRWHLDTLTHCRCHSTVGYFKVTSSVWRDFASHAFSAQWHLMAIHLQFAYCLTKSVRLMIWWWWWWWWHYACYLEPLATLQQN